MRNGILLHHFRSASDRQRLKAIVAAPEAHRNMSWRARIVLLSGDGLGTCGNHGRDRQVQDLCLAMAGAVHAPRHRRTASRPVPSAWKGACPAEACRRDRPPRRRLRRRMRPPIGRYARWPRPPALAASTVQGIWKAHGLSPHRWRHFKLSNDPAFAGELDDHRRIVCQSAGPCRGAVGRREVAEIQALNRTQPGLPMKKGQSAGTMSTMTTSGTAQRHSSLPSTCWTARSSRQNMQRHRHQEFIRFLNRIEREVPADKAIHVILDNYAAHKRTARSAPGSHRHPRWTFQFHPDILLLAQRRRGLLRQAHPAQAQARRLPFRCRSSGRHQPLHPPVQCRQPTTIHLESQP